MDQLAGRRSADDGTGRPDPAKRLHVSLRADIGADAGRCTRSTPVSTRQVEARYSQQDPRTASHRLRCRRVACCMRSFAASTSHSGTLRAGASATSPRSAPSPARRRAARPRGCGPTAPHAPGDPPESIRSISPQWMNRHSNLPSPSSSVRSSGARLPRASAAGAAAHARPAHPAQQHASGAARARSCTAPRPWSSSHPEQRSRSAAPCSSSPACRPDRRRAVARAFRDLRSLPPEQRQAALNSTAFRSSSPTRSAPPCPTCHEPYAPTPASAQPPRPDRLIRHCSSCAQIPVFSS